MLPESGLPSEIAFALLKPDVLLRDLLFPILSFLEEKGFEILASHTAKVSDSHYRLMYSEKFLWNLDDWHHNRQLFAFGPAIGLLLRSGSFCAQEELNSLKGAALPYLRESGSLRKRFSSKSRTFNLIHAPDGKVQAELEARAWFGTLELQQTRSLQAVCEEIALAGYARTRNLDPEEAFLRAKIRLFLGWKNNRKLAEAIDFYSEWLDAIAATDEYNGVEGTLLDHFQAKETALLDRLMTLCDNDPKCARTLKIVRDADSMPFASNFFWMLDSWNVYLSELERYLIVSRLKYGAPASAPLHRGGNEPEYSCR